MSYRILTKNGIENTNIDGARNYNFNTNGKSGVLKGFLSECDLSVNGKEIVIASGELRLAGHRIVIDDSESFNIQTTPSALTLYSLIAKIAVTKTQPEFSIEVKVNPITLIQDNLHLSIDGNGTYEIELGTFEVDTLGNILNLTRTVNLLEISSGSSLTEEEKEKLDKIVIDESGNEFLANDGEYKAINIPTADSELSLDSDKPVQNKVITEALNEKAEKITAPTSTGVTYLYGAVSTKNPHIVPIANAVTETYTVNGCIPQYLKQDGYDHLFTHRPTRDLHCANKKYVDENKGSKLYKHTITVTLNGNSTPDFNIEFYSVKANTNSVIQSSETTVIDINVDGIITIPYASLTDVHTCILTVDGDSNPIYQLDLSNMALGNITSVSTEETYVGV